jgi:phosphatidylglycerol:prolipoprotein diacylglycerol transferase
MVYAAKNKNIDVNETIILFVISIFGVIIGSKLLYLIVNYEYLYQLYNTYSDNLFNLLKEISLRLNGSVFYGGLIGGIAAACIYLKLKKYDVLYFLDFMTPCIPLFHFWGRIGCFFAGCCYGVESKIGFTFHHSVIISANDVNRFPVQLLESFYNIILFFILITVLQKNLFKGKLLLLYLLMYSSGRFMIEFFRGDVYRGILFYLSTSQWISLIIINMAVYKLVRKRS